MPLSSRSRSGAALSPSGDSLAILRQRRNEIRGRRLAGQIGRPLENSTYYHPSSPSVVHEHPTKAVHHDGDQKIRDIPPLKQTPQTATVLSPSRIKTIRLPSNLFIDLNDHSAKLASAPPRVLPPVQKWLISHETPRRLTKVEVLDITHLSLSGHSGSDFSALVDLTELVNLDLSSSVGLGES